MASAAENLFCYVVAGFWVEIPEDDSRADVYLLADHDHEKGLEGKAAPYPVKRIDGRKDENGNPSHPATLLAARVWCLHAREQIRADADPGFDGDGSAPIVHPLSLTAIAAGFDWSWLDVPAPSSPVGLSPLSDESYAPEGGWNAAAAASVVQEGPPKKPAPKRRSKKG